MRIMKKRNDLIKKNEKYTEEQRRKLKTKKIREQKE